MIVSTEPGYRIASPERSPESVPERTAGATRVRSLEIAGPAGRLEALLNEGSGEGLGSSKFAGLVCHPHPKGGGTLHNKVVYHAMKVLNDRAWGFGFPVLRFNFRGVGLSGGVHDGRAEAGDVAAALSWLENEYKMPIVVAGFSFGAVMAVDACCSRRSVAALALLGLPVSAPGRSYDFSALSSCTTPKLFLSGDRDQFANVAELKRAVADAAEPKRLELVAGADHFFAGEIDAMQSALAAWMKEQLPWRR